MKTQAKIFKTQAKSPKTQAYRQLWLFIVAEYGRKNKPAVIAQNVAFAEKINPHFHQHVDKMCFLYWELQLINQHNNLLFLLPNLSDEAIFMFSAFCGAE